MRRLIVAVAALLAAAPAAVRAQSGAATAPALNSEAARSFSDFQSFGPHRAFAVGNDGKAYWWAGLGGADPGTAVANTMKRCGERSQGCLLHVVNNYTVTGQDWRAVVPARSADAPDIGRLRPEPYWSMRGPQLA